MTALIAFELKIYNINQSKVFNNIINKYLIILFIVVSSPSFDCFINEAVQDSIRTVFGATKLISMQVVSKISYVEHLRLL